MAETRSARITIRITPTEKARILRQARLAQRKEADWARLILMAACPEEPEPAEPLCLCGHAKDAHQDETGLGGAQCRTCFNGGEHSWRHPYNPQEVGSQAA